MKNVCVRHVEIKICIEQVPLILIIKFQAMEPLNVKMGAFSRRTSMRAYVHTRTLVFFANGDAKMDSYSQTKHVFAMMVLKDLIVL